MSEDAVPPGPRKFFVVVSILTLYVAFWGFLFPAGLPVQLPGFAKGFDDALPFNIAIPPLHARFLGAFYGSASLLLLAGWRARRWREVQITVWMILVWTGLLGIISFMHIGIFDWQRPPVWAWFLAYISFPIAAAWWLWRRPELRALGAAPEPGDPGLAAPLRAAFWILGLVLTPLAASLFLFPDLMAPYWPWKLPPILARIYGGPFMAYGVACLLAARTPGRSAIAALSRATLLFAVGTLIASLIHRQLFNFGAPATWLWFGGFSFAAIMTLVYGVRGGAELSR